MIRKITAPFILAAALLAGAAVPALAAAHVPFAVIVNGNVDVTSQHLTPGQVVYHDGTAYRVVLVRGSAVVFSPRLSAPSGTTLSFST